MVDGMTRRDVLKASALMAVTGCASAGGHPAPRRREFSVGPDCRIVLPVAGLNAPVRFLVIGDTHLGFHDARDEAYADNYRRMAQWPAPKDALAKALRRAKDASVDLVVLVGDILSFPTLANVDFALAELESSGLPWVYTAGNHDWHFEGEEGDDAEQRDRWIGRRLAPFYHGENPLAYSKVVKGVRFVMIDNSEYHVTPEQLAFWRQEASVGDPVVLCMHVPLWTDGWGLFTCGNPDWGAAADPYWKIEGRRRWAERQSPSTFAFREAVLSTPNLAGVFTGHIHEFMAAQTAGQLMFSVPANRDGSSAEVELKERV